MATILTLPLVILLYQLCAVGSGQVDVRFLQCDCVSLKVANCVGKNLTYVPNNDALCEDTEVLNMSYNMLGSTREHDYSNIPSSVRSLDISFNLIETVRDVCIPGDAIALRKLNMSHNRISDLNSFMFQSCPDLSHVDLSNNRILSIATDSFSSLVKLNYLDLSYNALASLHLHSFDALEILLANKNNISEVTMEEPLRLAYLNLDCNNFSHVPAFDRSWRGNLSLSCNPLPCYDTLSFVQSGNFNLLCEEDNSHVCDDCFIRNTAMCSSTVFSTSILAKSSPPLLKTFNRPSNSYQTQTTMSTKTSQNSSPLISFEPILVGFVIFVFLSFLLVGLVVSVVKRKLCSGFRERRKGPKLNDRNSSLIDEQYTEILHNERTSLRPTNDISDQRQPFSVEVTGTICRVQENTTIPGIRGFDRTMVKQVNAIRQEIHAKSECATRNTGGSSAEEENNGYVHMKPIN